jgi:hypothetical protein
MGSGGSFCYQVVSLHENLGCAREPHTSLWVSFEWACRYLSYGARQFLPLDRHDQAWRWLGRYDFHKDSLTDASYGQQVQLPQVFQLEDPGVWDPIYMQGAVWHGRRSAASTW